MFCLCFFFVWLDGCAVVVVERVYNMHNQKGAFVKPRILHFIRIIKRLITFS